MKVWLFGLSAGLSFVLLITAGSINSTEIQENYSDSNGFTNSYFAYAIFFGLDPTNLDEACLDYDGDQLNNREESVKLTDPFFPDTDRDGFDDLVDSNAVSRAYICWGDPQFTTGDQYEYAHPDWFLGAAYKNGGEWILDTATTQSAWYVSGNENNIASLNIDLDRSILTTNNLRYAVHYSAGSNASLYLNLLDTNGAIACHANGVVAENLFGNLLTVSNVARYVVIPAEAGIQSTNAVLILEIPTATFPSVAVIQLRYSASDSNVGLALARSRSEDGSGEIFIYEGLLYIDEDGDGLDADQERQIGTSDYSVDSNNNGTNDYDECFNTGSSTNNPGGDGGGDDDGKDKDEEKDKQKGIIYVDQALGNDAFSGRSPAISANKGPKKTVHGGLSIAETNDTIIIRSGVYNENLDIRGKDVKVFIEGNVRL